MWTKAIEVSPVFLIYFLMYVLGMLLWCNNCRWYNLVWILLLFFFFAHGQVIVPETFFGKTIFIELFLASLLKNHLVISVWVCFQTRYSVERVSIFCQLHIALQPHSLECFLNSLYPCEFSISVLSPNMPELKKNFF